MKLLCEHHPNHVYSALMSYYFPLDESLALVEEHKVYDAIAFLKYKLGRIKDALEDFKQVIPL